MIIKPAVSFLPHMFWVGAKGRGASSFFFPPSLHPGHLACLRDFASSVMPNKTICGVIPLTRLIGEAVYFHKFSIIDIVDCKLSNEC